MQRENQVHIVIPEGTKVLTRSGGRVGVVSHAPNAPEHSYRVRFPDGAEESLRRADLAIFKHVQAEVPGGPHSTDLYRFVIYRCIVGSTAYGLSQDGSDTDRRGFYLPPADLEWSLAGAPEQLETEDEEVYWEIEKFIRLALKANPNVLECLYSPLVETCTPLAHELIEMRHIFLSQYVHRTCTLAIQETRAGSEEPWPDSVAACDAFDSTAALGCRGVETSIRAASGRRIP